MSYCPTDEVVLKLKYPPSSFGEVTDKSEKGMNGATSRERGEERHEGSDGAVQLARIVMRGTRSDSD